MINDEMKIEPEVFETGLTTKAKVIIGGVAGFVLILTAIIFKLLKKKDILED